MIKHILAIFLVFGFIFESNAQNNIQIDTSDYRYGLILGYNFNFHSAEFRELPGIPNCCPLFESGSGGGITMGLEFEMPFLEEYQLKFRALYMGVGATLETEEMTKVNINGQDQDRMIIHTIDASLSKISLEPLFTYKLTDKFSLMGGLNLGFLIGASYEQKEELIDSQTGTFENGLKERLVVSGDINETSAIQAALALGMGYEFPLNKENTLTISPEIFYYIGFTPFIADSTWSANTLRLGVAVNYRPVLKNIEVIKKYEKYQIIDTVSIKSDSVISEAIKKGDGLLVFDTLSTETELIISETYKRTDTLLIPEVTQLIGHVRSVGFDGLNEYPQIKMQVQEIPKINFTPLLTYIFYGHMQDSLPAQYVKLSPEEANAFSIDKLFNKGTLAAYNNILNIIGYRLRYNDKAKITLTGCNSGIDDEKNNFSLSKKRALSVQNYLEDVWKINPDRIKIVKRNLPIRHSGKDLPDGIEENRRVEISSDSWEITKPVITNDTIREIFAPRIKFFLELNAPNLLSEWRLKVSHNGTVLKEFFGKDKIPEKIVWRINEEKEIIPGSDEPIEYVLTLTDIHGNVTQSEKGSINIETYTTKSSKGKRITDNKTETFSLILFDFDEEKMDKDNRKILDFIKTRLNDNSKVTIEGYTDRTGEADYNLELSDKRAKEAAKILNAKDAIANGYGEINPLYDNDTPEGRFYSRTVIIIVETPIEDE